MFSGIVETQTQVLDAQKEGGLVRILVARPPEFDDLRVGDSVCVNGVCLTVEKFGERTMLFALGEETLKITGWDHENLPKTFVNVERSLKLGDRIHGHMVSGHVDAVGEVVSAQDAGGSRIIEIRVPNELKPFVWKKGSLAVNGVSLTVNDIKDGVVSLCLIPETLTRTNLSSLQAGMRVNLEADMLARGLVHALKELKEQELNR